MKSKHLFLTFFVVMLSGCATQRYGQVPKTTPGVEAFFECSHCHSLYGGVIYTNVDKNLLQCWTPAARHCAHDWVRIDSKTEFVKRVEKLWPGMIDGLATSQPPSYYWVDSVEKVTR